MRYLLQGFVLFVAVLAALQVHHIATEQLEEVTQKTEQVEPSKQAELEEEIPVTGVRAGYDGTEPPLTSEEMEIWKARVVEDISSTNKPSEEMPNPYEGVLDQLERQREWEAVNALQGIRDELQRQRWEDAKIEPGQ